MHMIYISLFLELNGGGSHGPSQNSLEDLLLVVLLRAALHCGGCIFLWAL